MKRRRDWRGPEWAARSRKIRRRPDGSIRRCRCCLWRRSQEAHHLRPGRVNSKAIPLCAWCHHRITAADVRSIAPTWFDTYRVILRQWAMTAAVVAMVAGAILLTILSVRA